MGNGFTNPSQHITALHHAADVLGVGGEETHWSSRMRALLPAPGCAPCEAGAPPPGDPVEVGITHETAREALQTRLRHSPLPLEPR